MTTCHYDKLSYDNMTYDTMTYCSIHTIQNKLINKYTLMKSNKIKLTNHQKLVKKYKNINYISSLLIQTYKLNTNT